MVLLAEIERIAAENEFESPPLHEEEWQFIGWIPCLAGELLFKHTLPSLAEYDIAVVNFLGHHEGDTDEKIRYVAATSVYDWRDFSGSQSTGVFRIVVVAKTDKNSMRHLKGDLFFISETSIQSSCGKPLPPKQHDHEEDLVCLLRKLAADALTIQKEVSYSGVSCNLDKFAKIQRAFSCLPEYDTGDPTIYSLIASINDKYVHRVGFSIDNAGFCKLKYEGLKNPVTGEFRAPSLPEGSPLGDAQLREHSSTLCRQAFYYLKYLLHKHAHHDPSNDSLATTHRYRGETPETARALLHDMKAGLVDVKRAIRQETVDFAGIATSGKSLVTSCFKSGFFGKDERASSEYKAQQDYFDHLSQSILLLNERQKPKRDRRRQRLTAFQQLLTVSFLFFTPLILIGRDLPFPMTGVPAPESGNFIGFFSELVARLGHGDIQLLVKSYVLLFSCAFIFHFHLIDTTRVVRTTRKGFESIRSKAFSFSHCRKGYVEHIVWFFHRGILVTLRRSLRGIEYKDFGFAAAVIGFALSVFVSLGGVWLILVGLGLIAA